MMYGYATNETSELMLAPLVLTHKIDKGIKKLNTTKQLALFGPEGKYHLDYIYENDNQVTIDIIIISSQTTRHANIDILREAIIEKVLTLLVFDFEYIRVLINSIREFINGDSEFDACLTVRKIIVHTYCVFSHHGGGVFLIKLYQ